MLNVTRDRCCAACTDEPLCQAFAYGRDSADPGHRHNCYLCQGLNGTRPSANRDFGCVARMPAGGASPPNFVFDKAGRPRGGPVTPAPEAEFYGTRGAFTSDPAEAIIGLGQHSAVTGPGCDGSDHKCGQWKLNNKGFTWPLEITKYQITVPFFVSNRQYGFFWNHPGDGAVAVGNTSIEWTSVMQKQVDFWVTAAPVGRSPFASIMSSYVDATGHAPVLPGWATGFWQSKMRYRTTDELLEINSGYKSRNINLSVIVIDFYSWSKFGDFAFDKTCWPNMSIATAQLGGTRVLRSTYPWVDKTSTGYAPALAAGVLTMETGNKTAYPSGGKAMIDPFAPNAREFVWARCKESFYDQGIEMFWLDDTEPNVPHQGLVYACGPTEYCGGLWPQRWTEIFSEGVKEANGGVGSVMLSRAAWAGFQTTGAALWSSDIPSTFESLQTQVRGTLEGMFFNGAWNKGEAIERGLVNLCQVRSVQRCDACLLLEVVGVKVGDDVLARAERRLEAPSLHVIPVVAKEVSVGLDFFFGDETVGSVLCQEAVDDHRRFLLHVPRALGLLGEDAVEELVLGVPVERRLAGQHLVHHHAERPPVDATAVGQVLDDLRCDVVWCTAERGRRLPGSQVLLGKAKIGQLDVTLAIEHHVV